MRGVQAVQRKMNKESSLYVTAFLQEKISALLLAKGTMDSINGRDADDYHILIKEKDLYFSPSE